MRLLIIAWVFFICHQTIGAQSMDEIIIWPNKLNGQNNVKEQALKNAVTTDNITRIEAIEHPFMQVFKPEDSVNNGKGIIVCPGGGYNILAIDLEGEEVADWLTKLGYTAYVLYYSVPKKKRAALNDLHRAIQLVRKSASNYNIDPDKIGVIGFSAGGSLCARVSTMSPEKGTLETDGFEGISALPNFAILIYPAFLDKGIDKSLSPELHIHKNTPPMFIFGTADDPHGNSALVMASALRNSKKPVDLHFLSEGGHGYGLRKGNIAAETWPVLLETWLKKNEISLK